MHPRPIIPCSEINYLNEHLSRAEEAVRNMRAALEARDAQELLDNFSALQWQERSLLAGCNTVMRRCKFSMKDLMARPLDQYEDKENTIAMLFELM
jgi:hypothetical protein